MVDIGLYSIYIAYVGEILSPSVRFGRHAFCLYFYATFMQHSRINFPVMEDIL